MYKQTAYTHVGSDVLEQPFFRPRKYADWDRSTATKEYDFSEFGEKYVGESMKKIYRGITDPDKGFGLSNNWVFFSPNEIFKLRDSFIDCEKCKMLDIGLKYHGMGYIIMISHIPEDDTFYFRIDGGSNPYEVNDMYVTYSNEEYKPNAFPLKSDSDVIEKKTRYKFDTFMKLIENDDKGIPQAFVKVFDQFNTSVIHL